MATDRNRVAAIMKQEAMQREIDNLKSLISIKDISAMALSNENKTLSKQVADLKKQNDERAWILRISVLNLELEKVLSLGSSEEVQKEALGIIRATRTLRAKGPDRT